ncbi:MAG: nickel pincer cofactor biosynthesis protein LarB [Oscillospiraceae bacterium]|nr:nickel pincer cofactor biosynthesis protein LarB [Oscillospiraceae bacterium]
MDKQEILSLLRSVAAHEIAPEQALLTLKQAPFADLDYAKIDLHRGLRQGVPEVIYGAGKTAEQIFGIVQAMQQHGQSRILITRISPEKAAAVAAAVPFHYHETGQIGLIGDMPEPSGHGSVVIATGGTSDQPVAEEAAFTAEVLGNRVIRLYDVGVSGLHRLLAHMDEIMSASVIVAVAGMEGALASVIGGLADCPVIAVPTSVGYGAAFGGVSALLSMLNSCASGVSVVNIDNGFGAGYQASQINHIGGLNENTIS